jgi:hypothetical protein
LAYCLEPDRTRDIEVTQAQIRNFALAYGFQILARKPTACLYSSATRRKPSVSTAARWRNSSASKPSVTNYRTNPSPSPNRKKRHLLLLPKRSHRKPPLHRSPSPQRQVPLRETSCGVRLPPRRSRAPFPLRNVVAREPTIR